MPNRVRTYFKDWVRKQAAPDWPALPLVHITKTHTARDIIADGRFSPQARKESTTALLYFFYGRAGYRLKNDGAIKSVAACPFCVIMTGDLLSSAYRIYPFDTGAYHNRLYRSHLIEEMGVDDFAITEADLPNRLIHRLFGSRENYFVGDTSVIPPTNKLCSPGELDIHAYLELITSAGRNEPDDRVCSIEVVFDREVPLEDSIEAIIVPHVIWNDTPADWLAPLSAAGVTILPYEFHPNKGPEHYSALLELELRKYLRARGLL